MTAIPTTNMQRGTNYTPVPGDLTAFDLPVEGAIRAELERLLSAQRP
jgi:hypothetical protein